MSLKKVKNERAITLIALVVTIIILIILATISIGAIWGEDGLIEKAQKAKEMYEITTEREYLEQNVMSVQIGRYMQNVSAEKLGKELNGKSIEHSIDWHIVKEGETRYETGWNLIEKGTVLENYGEAQYNWVVNYATGEIIQLEDDNYLSVQAGDMVAVKEDLIINIDSSIIDDGVEQTKEKLEERLGEGVDLVNFDFSGDSQESGLTENSFNFDGVDDYIKVVYNKEEQKAKLTDRGFTFEFYGKILDSTGRCRVSGDNFGGLFCYWNGDETKQACFRFGNYLSSKSQQNSKFGVNLWWNAADGTDFSDFCDPKYPYNIYYPDVCDLGDDSYITVTLDTTKIYTDEDINRENYLGIASETKIVNGEYYKQTVYVNGQEKYSGYYNTKVWDRLTEIYLSELNTFCVGRSSWKYNGGWWYTKMKAYCLRLYSRGLSEEEVKANYEKATVYHSLLGK